jgi:DNA modification methylase
VSEPYRILIGDCIERMGELPERSVQCCVTSPPYFALRDYGMPGQIGLEPTLDEYIARMVDVFRAVRRVLRDDGVLFLNVGDSYTGSASTGGTGKETAYTGKRVLPMKGADGMKPKDLMGVPWMLAFALRADGWYLRSDIIWAKPNPMPESVTDRPTKSHEYIFLLTKSERYFYDAEAVKEAGETGSWTAMPPIGGIKHPGNNGNATYSGNTPPSNGTRNRRTVWTIATQPYSEAHFATYPEKLVEPCILAGTSEKGCCPECGKPWERVVELIGGRTSGRTHERLAAAERAGKPNGASYGS